MKQKKSLMECIKIKTNKCHHCKEIIVGRKKKFCNNNCSTQHRQESLRMNFNQGQNHNEPHTVDDCGIPTVHIPHKILQEVKNIFDDQNHCMTDGRKIVEDTEEIFKTTNRILNRTLTESSRKITQLNQKRKYKFRKKDDPRGKNIPFGFGKQTTYEDEDE